MRVRRVLVADSIGRYVDRCWRRRQLGALVTPWKPPFGGPLPADPSLDAFRNSVARLMCGSRTVGYIAFRADHSSRLVRGHLWWREWAMPKEVVEWMQTMVDGSDSDDVTQMSDGIIEDPAANDWLRAVRSGEADDFRAARAEIRYRVVWLRGAERTAAWERYGYGGADQLGSSRRAGPGGSHVRGTSHAHLHALEHLPGARR